MFRNTNLCNPNFRSKKSLNHLKVKKNRFYGTVNWKNEIVHPIQYDEIFWEWPYLTGRSLDTVYIKNKGQYFTTDTTGNIIDNKISAKLIEERFQYLLN